MTSVAAPVIAVLSDWPIPQTNRQHEYFIRPHFYWKMFCPHWPSRCTVCVLKSCKHKWFQKHTLGLKTKTCPPLATATDGKWGRQWCPSTSGPPRRVRMLNKVLPLLVNTQTKLWVKPSLDCVFGVKFKVHDCHFHLAPFILKLEVQCTAWSASLTMSKTGCIKH